MTSLWGHIWKTLDISLVIFRFLLQLSGSQWMKCLYNPFCDIKNTVSQCYRTVLELTIGRRRLRRLKCCVVAFLNMCHCGSERPRKIPFGQLTHDNISRLQFIVQTFVCVCVKLRFSAKRWEHWFHQRKWLWKWVTSGLEPLIGWKCLSRLTQLPVSMNGAALWTNGRAVVRMQQWSRKKHPIVPETLKKCDLPPAGTDCSALTAHWPDPISHWQVWRTGDIRFITWQFIIGSLWVSEVFIFGKRSSNKKMLLFHKS